MAALVSVSDREMRDADGIDVARICQWCFQPPRSLRPVIQTLAGDDLTLTTDLAFRALTVLGATLAGIGGLLAFFLTRYWNARDRRQEREWRAREQEMQTREAERAAIEASRARFREVLFESLRWFEGKTQRRSIGISIVEASWDEYPELRPIWRGVLVNQAVYLLTVSEQKEKLPEIANLRRIMAVLVREASDLDSVSRASLRTALESRLRGSIGGGVEVDSFELSGWWQDAGFNVG